MCLCHEFVVRTRLPAYFSHLLEGMPCVVCVVSFCMLVFIPATAGGKNLFSVTLVRSGEVFVLVLLTIVYNSEEVMAWVQ